MSARVVVELGDRNAWVRGPGALVHPALRAARSPRSYDKRKRALVIPRGCVDDVLAALELQSGADVEVVEVSA